jgi:predicted ferric reductase/Ca2+-binding EF-hand superfamily protein
MVLLWSVPPTSGEPSPIDTQLLATLEKAFAAHAGGDDRIDVADLQRALGLRSVYLARRILLAFDTNGDGVISRDEFLSGARTLILGSDREKLHFAFRLHDHDGDGTLDRQEIERMIAMSLAESEIAESATQTAETLARALLSAADRDGDGRVSFEELFALVSSRPDLLRRMTRHEAIWLAPNEELLVLLDERAAGARATDVVRPRQGYADGTKWVALAVVLAANVILFAAALVRGMTDAPPVEIWTGLGRSFARCADLDGALILLPVLRRLLTRVRATALGRVLPIDDAIDVHRWLGHSLFAVGLAHGLCSVAAFAVGHPKSPWLHVLSLSRGLTGALLTVVFVAMWTFSLRAIRSRRFELFYFTHLLYVAWLFLAFAHAPRFAFWAGVPALALLVEQVLRGLRRAPSSAVVSSRPLRSGVTRLEIARPEGFKAQPADYCFLCIPALAKHEWHPFTISSAPERDNLVFHVRSLGDWTGALRKHVDEKPDDPALEAYVDGPYGTPSTEIFECRFPILIGAGIGVTPFASVLESLVLGATHRGTAPKLEKVHFFWLNSGQQSFEWFRDLLAEIERRDERGLLELHLCMTGTRTGVSAMGLEIAREIMHSAKRSDIITGLHTHTHLGAPDWNEMLSKIAAGLPEAPRVFYCGPVGLERKLRPVCQKLGLSFRAERF